MTPEKFWAGIAALVLAVAAMYVVKLGMVLFT